jgi:hypothetical protein
MGRRITGWWDDRARRYMARLGPASDRTGKPRPVVLKDADGRDIPFGGEKADKVPAVQAAIARILGEREAAERRTAGPTVAEVCRSFVAWHAENGSAQRTVEDHHYHLGRFSGFLHAGARYADRAARSIEPEDLWRLKKAGLGSIRLLYASVLACWRWASRPVEGRSPTRLLPENPLAGIAKPPRGARRTKTVPWAVARQLLRFARARARRPARTRRERTRAAERLRVLCLHLIATTGCRPFEAEGLIAVAPTRAKDRRPGRPAEKPRRIAVPRGLLRALALVRDWRDAHPRWVFVPAWTRGKAGLSPKALIAWFGDELKPAAIAAGVPLAPETTLYYFRHAWQTMGLEVESAEGVSAAAGNSPEVLLSTYEHTTNRRIREVAGKVEAARRRGRGDAPAR